MKLRARLALGVLLLAGLSVTGAGVAQASDGLCASGYACGYDGYSYGDPYYGTSYTERNWNLASFGNVAGSVSANGASCKYTRYYKSWNYITNHVYGDYFTMYSRQLMGYNYRDPNLTNGAGYDGTGNWDNTIEGTLFTGCS